MDINPLELLKFLFLTVELVSLFYSLKREKALIASLEKNNQHLAELENKLRKP